MFALDRLDEGVAALISGHDAAATWEAYPAARDSDACLLRN